MYNISNSYLYCLIYSLIDIVLSCAVYYLSETIFSYEHPFSARNIDNDIAKRLILRRHYRRKKIRITG